MTEIQWKSYDFCKPLLEKGRYYIADILDYELEPVTETFEGLPMLTDERDWQYQIEDDRGLRGSEKGLAGDLTADSIDAVVLKIVSGTSNVGDTFKVSEIGYGKYPWKTHPLTKQVLKALSQPISQTEFVETPEFKTALSAAASAALTKLIKFYGKDETYRDMLSGYVKVEDYYFYDSDLVAPKILISVDKENFDLLPDNPDSCNIDIPEEKIVAQYPVSEIDKKLNLVHSGMKELLPSLAEMDVFISNVNIENEIRNLNSAKSELAFYLNSNNIQPMRVSNPDCSIPQEESRILKLGFDLDYKLRYVLIDDEQHTIGYDCLLEQPEFSHITTSHYLTRLDEMIVELKNRESDEFDFLVFLKRHTLPEPIVEPKEKTDDGTNAYDENGNFSPSQPFGPVKSCKTNEELARETQSINAPITKLNRAGTAKAETENVGPEETTPSAIQEVLDNITGIDAGSAPNTEPGNNDLLSKQQVLENNEQGKTLYQNIDYTLNDVVAKIDIGLLLQQSIPTMLSDLVINYGTEMYEDADLKPVFELQDELKGVTNTQEKFGSFAIKAAGPVLQDMELPPFFPNNKDFLKPTLDQLKINLGNLLLQGAISIVVETFQDFTDFTLSNPNQIREFVGKNTEYKTWLSETAGISIDDVSNSETFSSILTLRGGRGFSGIISNLLSKKSSPSRLDISGFELSDVPISDSLAIIVHDSDKLQEKYLKQSDLVQITGEISTGVDELSAVLKPDEFKSLLKGRPSKETLSLSTEVLTRNASHDGIVFKNKQDVLDVFAGLGKLLNPSFLTGKNKIQSVANNTNILENDQISVARAQLLKIQSPTLSDSEINQIIEKEKQRKKQRVLKAFDKLTKYERGDLLPKFPDLFGFNGLIPEIPPIVKDVSEKTAVAIIDPVTQVFSSDVAPPAGARSYTGYWNQSLGNFGYLRNNPEQLFTNFSLTSENDQYSFGYTPSATATTTVPTVTLNGSTSGYNFGLNFNVDNKGLDADDADIIFQQMKETFGITDSWEDWYYNNIAPFIEETDNSCGGIQNPSEQFLDPFDENIKYEVVVDKSDCNDKLSTIRQYTIDPGTQIDARPAGFSDNIVVLTVNGNLGYQKVSYTSDVYKINSTLADLGNKNTTGELNTRSFSSTMDLVVLSDMDPNSTELVLEGRENIEGDKTVFGSKINSNSVNSSIIAQFARYIEGQKYSSAFYDGNTNTVSSDFNFINLSYLDTDIFNVEALKQETSDMMGFLLNASLTGEYCDSLSEIRRNTLNTSLRLLARAFIVEQALMSIQVFNGFDLNFMDNQIFANSVYSLMKKEISKYQESFDTLESSLLQDIRESALKYYEIMNLAGQATEMPTTGKEAVRQIILDEAKILKEPITLALNLKWNATTWNGFLTKVIFGEYSNSTYQLTNPRDTSEFIKIPILSNAGRSFTQRTDTIMQYGGSTYIFVTDNKKNDDGSFTYSYSLVYIEKQSILSQIDNWTSDYIIYDEETSSFDDAKLTGWEGTTILSVECTRESVAADSDEVYDSLAKLMFETDEYKRVFEDFSPVKVFISCMSLYQVSALSDPATFGYYGNPLDSQGNPDPAGNISVPYIGIELHDFMAKTKVTILQLFASSIYGGGKIDYQDPFIQKAQP